MSSFYQRYYEGYEDECIHERDGKGKKIERKYVGIYYRQSLTRSVQLLIRFFYIIIISGAFGLFFYASIQPLGCNTVLYAIICQGLAILSFIWVIWVLLSYVIAERDMRIYTYKSTSLKLIKVSMLSVIAVGLNVLSAAVYILLHVQEEPKKQLICLGEYALSASFLFLLNRLEKEMPYKKIPNAEKGKE